MPNRVIKESIKTSEQIDSLTWFEEVLYYRLLVTADDYGCADGRITLLKSELFPLKENVTKKSVEDAVSKLVKVGLLYKYTANDKPYLFFPTWEKHQRIRNKHRKYPNPFDSRSAYIRPTNDGQASAVCTPESELESESESNPNPIEPIGSCAAPKNDAPPEAVISLPLIDKTEYFVSPEQCQEWAGLYPAVDVMQQLRSMRGWLDANPANRKTRTGIKRFVNAWLSRAQNQAGRVKPKAGGNVFLDIAREEGLT